MNRVSAIIAAAGEGKRFGAAKQFALLKGRPVLDWSLMNFQAHEAIDSIVLVLGAGRPGTEYLDRYGKIAAIAEGGKTRQDSVYSGLDYVDAGETDIILVHDGVRPLVGKDLIDRIIQAARNRGAVVPVVPVEDTLKRVDGLKVIQTEDRKHFFRVQTPQGFACSLLKEAYETAIQNGFEGTDEAALVEWLGKDVFVIPGDPRNLKITTADDLRVAEALIED